MAISQLIKREFDGGKDLSGIGGVETGGDAAEFLLLGANSVQVSCHCKRTCRLTGSTPLAGHVCSVCHQLGCQSCMVLEGKVPKQLTRLLPAAPYSRTCSQAVNC